MPASAADRDPPPSPLAMGATTRAALSAMAAAALWLAAGWAAGLFG
jgi:hypothetical protein